ncbi:protein phosphatase inhibitor 2-like [Amphibalanus amphitrite]|uniref:protein phosphatase inhibitor 2-like n=1 Tax=Amphibalanus amphitrite TaxID=1232801 RepID=UPI001C8FB332|nr:protein phosphatase inhibitor 2-like [Amphibalanus amphitrite]XP_043223793.1 protein phosphatase inhibitor 2-like [Amphibalanus amphitrite]
MAEQLKPPKKGILKNSTSFDKTERKSSLKETKWDEMNIIATFHPADKDYGHMKIEEPKTPFNYACPDEAAETAETEAIDSDVLAQKIRLGAEQPLKAMEQVDEDDEENMTAEQLEAHRQFEAKRKSHYNEFYAVKLARQLMEKDEELLEAESEEGAGPSSAAGPSSSSAEPAPAPDSAPSTSS